MASGRLFGLLRPPSLPPPDKHWQIAELVQLRGGMFGTMLAALHQLKEWKIAHRINVVPDFADAFENLRIVYSFRVLLDMRICRTENAGNFCFSDGVHMVDYPAQDKLGVIFVGRMKVTGILGGKNHAYAEHPSFTDDGTEGIEILLEKLLRFIDHDKGSQLSISLFLIHHWRWVAPGGWIGGNSTLGVSRDDNLLDVALLFQSKSVRFGKRITEPVRSHGGKIDAFQIPGDDQFEGVEGESGFASHALCRVKKRGILVITLVIENQNTDGRTSDVMQGFT